MRKEFLAAGRGGQGILILGHVLGLAAAKYTGLYVTGTESYDAETRGGDSRVDLIFTDSQDELDYFKVRSADIALFMYSDQLLKYRRLVGNEAIVFIDSSFHIPELRSSWQVYRVPYTDMAEEKLGTHVVANMIALGHIIRKTGLIDREAVISSIKEVVRKRWVSVDLKAFELGMELDP